MRVNEKLLRAQINGTKPDFNDIEAEFPELVAEGLVTLRATRERIKGQKAVLQSRINQRRQSVDIFSKQAVNLENQLKLIAETVALREDLYKSGHGSKVNLINAELEKSKIEGALTESRISVEQAKSAIEEARHQLTELQVTEQDKAFSELKNILGELAEVRQNINQPE